MFFLLLCTPGPSPGKPVEFRRRPEPVYDPFAADDVERTSHRLEVAEVGITHSLVPLHPRLTSTVFGMLLHLRNVSALWKTWPTAACSSQPRVLVVPRSFGTVQSLHITCSLFLRARFFVLTRQGIYYALADGETLDTPGVRLPHVQEFFADLVQLNSIIHHGEWPISTRENPNRNVCGSRSCRVVPPSSLVYP